MASNQPDGISAHQRPLVPPITIAVMGARGSGKSTFINKSHGFDPSIVASTLEPGTPGFQLANEFALDGQRVLLVETPGFGQTPGGDAGVLGSTAAALATAYENGSKLAGIIFIHHISDENLTHNFNMLLKLCGDSALKNVILVTNMWEDREGYKPDDFRQFFDLANAKGAQITCHNNTTLSAHDTIRRIMKNHPVPLQIQTELVDEHKNLVDTAAGQAVNDVLNDLVGRYRSVLKEIHDKMMQALETDDVDTRRGLELRRLVVQGDMNQIRTALDEMEAKYKEEKCMMERAIRRVQEQVCQERERVEVEYRRQMDHLDGHLQQSTNLMSLLRGGQH